tara:strand:- start:1321 stop:1992 length:672 start_codon:yes stop_codon:yes gene_type:complete
MLQRKGKIILIYLFLLVLVGSINNIDLNKFKFPIITDIKVLGLSSENNLTLLQNIKNLNLGNIFHINSVEIQNIIDANNLVEKYTIIKRYPSSLYINIDKTKFLARINYNGKIFLVGSNGKLTHQNFFANSLPFIDGNPDIKEFLKLKKIIDSSKFEYENIKNIFFFPSTRWDIELNNNMKIKLPQNNIAESLESISNFLLIQKNKDIKLIDARITNQIITND